MEFGETRAAQGAVHCQNPHTGKEVDTVRRAALLFAGAAIWLFLFAIPVMADNGPHVKGQNATALQGSCAGCHRAHSGQAPYLLKDIMPNLCYSCHGAGGVGASNDVQDGVGYLTAGGLNDQDTTHAGSPDSTTGTSVSASSTVQPLRGGGFQYALIDTNPVGGVPQDSNRTIGTLSAGVATNSSHSVDGTAVTMWGYGPNVTGSKDSGKAGVALTCASCHDPHGNGQYRILKPGPDDSYSGTSGTVQINDATTKSYVVPATGGYGVIGESNADNTIDGSPLNQAGTANANALQYDTATKIWSGTYLEASSRWCTTCHSRYMGYTGSAGQNNWTAGGTGDDLYKYKHATYDIVDSLTNSTPGALSGVITPIGDGTNRPTQVNSAAVLGTYASNGVTYRGIAARDSGGGVMVDGVSISGYVKVVGDRLTTHAPRCITCHVSHGSNAAVGTFATTGESLVTGTTFGTDSSLLRRDGRGVCQSCHKK